MTTVCRRGAAAAGAGTIAAAVTAFMLLPAYAAGVIAADLVELVAGEQPAALVQVGVWVAAAAATLYNAGPDLLWLHRQLHHTTLTGAGER